jgi:hypothetical protein
MQRPHPPRPAPLGAAVLCWLPLLTGPAAAAEVKLDEKVARPLKAMAEFLTKTKTFALTVDESFDVVQEDGLKLQSNRRRRVIVARPDRLFSDTAGDGTDTLFAYDRDSFILFDKEHNTYAKEKAPESIDKLLDELYKKYGIAVALSDFLLTDPYKALTGQVESGTYIGLTQIGEHKCHHLAFRQKTIDWQIWIEDGDKPLPRKFVITYKRLADHPQFAAVMHHWDLEPKLTDDTFRFTPPKKATKIDLVPPTQPGKKQ